MDNKIEDKFEKKVVTYPFSVNGMSLKAFKDFKSDAVENFNDSYASKIIFDHKFRKEQKLINILNDKVDMIYDNLIFCVSDLQNKITNLSNILSQLGQEKKENNKLEDELFQRRK